MASSSQVAARKSKRKQDLAAFSRRGDMDFEVESPPRSAGSTSISSKRIPSSRTRRRHEQNGNSGNRSPPTKRRCQPRARSDNGVAHHLGSGTSGIGALGDDSGSGLEVPRQAPRLREPIREEHFVLRRRQVDGLYEAVAIESVFAQLSELAEERASSHRQVEWQFVADQPPCVESVTLHSPVLVRLNVADDENPTYCKAEVVNMKGEAQDWRASVRLVALKEGRDMEENVLLDVVQDNLRMYMPLKKMEAHMMVNARHRLESMSQANMSFAADDSDSEVEAIMGPPSGDVRNTVLGKDRETRIPHRVFRTASTRTPGAFMSGSGEAGGEAFCKGDVLCLGNSSRKRYNGSQWRSLCNFEKGCDRESQRGGRCSMHSKQDTSKRSQPPDDPVKPRRNSWRAARNGRPGYRGDTQFCLGESEDTAVGEDEEAALVLIGMRNVLSEHSSCGASRSVTPSTPKAAKQPPVDFAVPGSPPKQAQAVVPNVVRSVQPNVQPTPGFPMATPAPTLPMPSVWYPHGMPQISVMATAPIADSSLRAPAPAAMPGIGGSMQPLMPFTFGWTAPSMPVPTSAYNDLQRIDWKNILPHMCLPSPWEGNGLAPMDNGWQGHAYMQQNVPQTVAPTETAASGSVSASGSRATGTPTLSPKAAPKLAVKSNSADGKVQGGHSMPNLRLLSETAELHGQAATTPTTENGECAPVSAKSSSVKSDHYPSTSTGLQLPLKNLSESFLAVATQGKPNEGSKRKPPANGLSANSSSSTAASSTPSSAAATITRETTDESSLESAADCQPTATSENKVAYPTPSPDSQQAQGFRLVKSLSSSQRLSSIVQTPPITPDNPLPMKSLGDVSLSSISHQCIPHTVASLSANRGMPAGYPSGRGMINRSLFPGVDGSDSAISIRPLLPAGAMATFRPSFDPAAGSAALSLAEKRGATNMHPIAPKIAASMMSSVAASPSPSSLSISPTGSIMSSRTPTPTTSARRERKTDVSQRHGQRRKSANQPPLDFNGPQIRTCRTWHPDDRSRWCENCITKKHGCQAMDRGHPLTQKKGRRCRRSSADLSPTGNIALLAKPSPLCAAFQAP